MKALSLIGFTFGVLLFLTPSPSYAAKPKKQPLQPACAGALAKSKGDLEHKKDPYSYPNYKGPKNAVLEKLLATPMDKRALPVADACKYGRVFDWRVVLNSAGANIEAKEDGHWFRVFVNTGKIYGGPEGNEEDHMASVMPRAKFVKGSYTTYEPQIVRWIIEQYPELGPIVKQWRESGKEKGIIEIVKEGVVQKWLAQNPEYKNGVLVFPRPSLRNRVAQQAELFTGKDKYHKSHNIRQAAESGAEFFIETIASLFDPQLAEENFEDLNKVLLFLAGPHVSRLSQIGTVKLIAQWVLTQYPDLAEIANNPNLKKDKDSLSARFGRTLGVIPVEWATGDLRQAIPFISKLEELPADWESKTLSKLIQFLRHETAPKLVVKRFELKDPDTGIRRLPKTGDEVALWFKPDGLGNGSDSYLNQHAVEGVVHALVVDEHGEAVGIQVKHWNRENDTSPYSPILGVHENPATYWFVDFEVEDSKIIKSTDEPAMNVPYSAFKFPEDSGEVTLPYGKSEMQVPISVGDLISLHVNRSKYGDFYDVIVTGFVRNQDGTVVAIKGYKDTKSRFHHMTGLNRNEDGTPVSIEHNNYVWVGQKRVDNIETTVLAENYKEETFYLEEIDRNHIGTSHGSGKNATTYFRQPQSPKRLTICQRGQNQRARHQECAKILESLCFRLVTGVSIRRLYQVEMKFFYM